MARERREQMLRDGYCVIPDILSPGFLLELGQESDRLNDTMEHHPDTKYQGTHIDVFYQENSIMQRLAEWKPARQALEQMGFDDFTSSKQLLILTKEPYAPALYWHQDWGQWNDPLSCTPWPQKIFLSYYLEDTSLENGCFQVIPGTHLKRIPLHDQLVTAHEQGARFIEENHPIMFSHHPDQVDVLTKAGSLVLGDARVLHAARKNQTDQRRNLLLLWHSRPKTVPDYWEGEIPLMFVEGDPEITYPASRIPGQYLPA